MNTLETLGDRIRCARGSIPQKESAYVFGINQNTLSRYERNERTPDADFIKIICIKNGILPEWLLFGTGPMRLDFEGSQAAPPCIAHPSASRCPHNSCDPCDSHAPHAPHNLPVPTPHDIVWIPLVDALLPAGHDSLKPCRPRQGEPHQGSPAQLEHGHLAYAQRLAQPAAQPAGTQRVHLADPQPEQRAHAFRRDFITHKGDPEHMVLLRASGDSMAPEIQHNDTVLIDQSLRTLSPGCIFAVAFEQAVYVKRLDYLPGKLVLSSANPAYPPVELSASGQSAEHFRILGRVLWVGRDLA